LQELVALLGELRAKGVDLYLHQQGLDTSTPAGKAMFQMLGVFAEFERAMIVERVRAGLRRARAQGKRLGRPRVGEKVEAAIRRELAKGRGIHAVARAVGVGAGTVQRVRAEPARTA
jgi:DNA invertase Pin-like site-specific DNA recombinase